MNRRIVRRLFVLAVSVAAALLLTPQHSRVSEASEQHAVAHV